MGIRRSSLRSLAGLGIVAVAVLLATVVPSASAAPIPGHPHGPGADATQSGPAHIVPPRNSTNALANVKTTNWAGYVEKGHPVSAGKARSSRGRAMRAGPAHIVPPRNSTDALASVKTTNWAGYVEKGHHFSVVKASWRQPKVSCASATATAAFWVGLDGYHSSSVEQAGSMGYCRRGKAYYYTWWEMYPSNKIQYVGKHVRAGDAITAVVIDNGNSYTLKVTDHTTAGNSFTRKITCRGCQSASAEWIAERTSGPAGLLPLAKFGRVTFSGAQVGVRASRGSIGKYAHDTVTMINHSGSTMASVSGLRAGGTRFDITWRRMK